MEQNENKDDIVKIDMKNLTPQGEQESVTKVDFSKPPEIEDDTNEEPVKDDGADEARVVGSDESADAVEEQEEVQAEAETQEAPALEEITEEKAEEPNEVVEDLVEEVQEAIAEAGATGEPLPENIQKLMDFMNETGGTLEDYVNLNKDYSDVD